MQVDSLPSEHRGSPVSISVRDNEYSVTCCGHHFMIYVNQIIVLYTLNLQSAVWGGLACCNPWGRKESDMTEQLSRTELVSRIPE